MPQESNKVLGSFAACTMGVWTQRGTLSNIVSIVRTLRRSLGTEESFPACYVNSTMHVVLLLNYGWLKIHISLNWPQICNATLDLTLGRVNKTFLDQECIVESFEVGSGQRVLVKVW